MANPSPLDATHRPRLRDELSAEHDGPDSLLFDTRRVGLPLRLSGFALHLVANYFDGTRTLAEIHSHVQTQYSITDLPLKTLQGLVQALDDSLLLDSPRFQERIGGPIRKPSCIGSYEEKPAALRKQLANLFTAPGGPGLPEGTSPASPHGRLRAVLVPHMDYGRGNVTYGWGFRALAEQTDARLFVILATSHYSPHRFTLSRQNFETPLGVVETDQPYIGRLVESYGDGLFDDPLAHVPEHSIELEVVLLQYLFAKQKPFRIVPLLVGSYADCVRDGTEPRKAKDVARMIAALRKAEAACPEPVCYVVSGDLAHIGPKFGDPKPVSDRVLAGSRKRDHELLAHAAAADPGGYFEAVAGEKDRRRICGLSPTYLALQAIRPKTGQLLHYQQFVHPEGLESVSFASMAFHS